MPVRMPDLHLPAGCLWHLLGSRRRRHPTEAEVVLLSGRTAEQTHRTKGEQRLAGCKDFQTSSDISGGIAGNRAAGSKLAIADTCS